MTRIWMSNRMFVYVYSSVDGVMCRLKQSKPGEFLSFASVNDDGDGTHEVWINVGSITMVEEV